RFKQKMRGALPDRVIEDIQKVADTQVLTGLAFNTAIGKRPGGGRGHAAAPVPEQPTGPTLRTLFGDIDACECSHCRSVLGPAAYLADLLHFLETSASSRDGTTTALESLMARRP